MSKINELRAQRAKTWEQTKAFLDSHRSDKGVLSVEDTATYEKMEQEIVDLGREIERQERLDAFERELNTPVNTPITQKPDTAKVDTKTGRASDTYKKAFWAQAQSELFSSKVEVPTNSTDHLSPLSSYKLKLIASTSLGSFFRASSNQS